MSNKAQVLTFCFGEGGKNVCYLTNQKPFLGAYACFLGMRICQEASKG